MNCKDSEHQWQWVSETGGVTTYYCANCPEVLQEFIDGIGG